MTYRYIYKITCTAGTFKDKFYFGQHTTKNLNDGYKGSGKKLYCYYKKFTDNYIKEIIAFYDTQEKLNQAEYDIIHPWLGNEMCLNISEGGNFKPICTFTGHNHTEETKRKQSLAHINKKHTELHNLHNSLSHIGQKAWNKGMKFEPLSNECKDKISKKLVIKNG